METFYSILGLERDASRKDIKKAFYIMAQKYHPDKVAALGDKIKMIAENEFNRISEAREVLLDDEKREEYDKLLDNRGIGDYGDDISFGAHHTDDFMDEKARMKRENVYLQTMVVDLRHRISVLEQDLEEERRYSAHLAGSPNGTWTDSPDTPGEDVRASNDDEVSAPVHYDNGCDPHRWEGYDLETRYDEEQARDGWELEYEDGYRMRSPDSSRPVGKGYGAVEDEMRDLEEIGRISYGREKAEQSRSRSSMDHRGKKTTPPTGVGLDECPFCGRESAPEQTYCYFCGTVY